MTTNRPQETTPIYRSRKEAREARRAQEAGNSTLETSMSTDVDTDNMGTAQPGEAVDALAGGSSVQASSVSGYRKTVPAEETPAPSVGLRCRLRKLPVAAGVTLLLFLGGFITYDAMPTPAPADSLISSVPAAAEPAVQVKPEAPKPAPVVPAVMTTGNIPVAQRLDFNASYGTINIPKFEVAPHDLREMDSLTPDYKHPTNTEAERAANMETVQNTEDSQGRYITGHYGKTQMFGEAGTVGVAGHRGVGDKSPFTRITELVTGDEAVIETKEGTYVYSYLRQTPETPKEDMSIRRSILDPVYRTADKAGKPVERALVITTCGLFTEGEHAGDGNPETRIASYFEFKSFTPRK